MQKILLLHGNIIRIISYNPILMETGRVLSPVNMRGGKSEVNSFCDVIILSLLYWCHGLILFFCLFPFIWVGFSLVFVQMETGLMLQYTWYSQISTQKDPAGGDETGVAVGWWCPSQLLPVGCDIHSRHIWFPHLSSVKLQDVFG